MSLGDDHGYGDPGSRGGDGGAYGGTGQTRTRLPEPRGDVYGGVRRTRQSSSRSLVTVVGVVVLLIAAIAFANRGGDDTDKSTSDNSDPRTSATAPSGERPVTSKTDGIPTGYTRDEQGAQSAAANYAIALGSAEMFDTERRHSIVNTVYTRDVADEQLPQLDEVYARESFLTRIGLNKDGTTPSGQTFISRVIPVGTKVVSTEGGITSVAVWYTSLFGLSGEGSKNPVTESWYTTTYRLKWDGDWKVVDFTQKDGPVPVGRDQRASNAEDMTKAVEEYGGFTYAR